MIFSPALSFLEGSISWARPEWSGMGAQADLVSKNQALGHENWMKAMMADQQADPTMCDREQIADLNLLGECSI